MQSIFTPKNIKDWPDPKRRLIFNLADKYWRGEGPVRLKKLYRHRYRQTDKWTDIRNEKRKRERERETADRQILLPELRALENGRKRTSHRTKEPTHELTPFFIIFPTPNKRLLWDGSWLEFLTMAASGQTLNDRMLAAKHSLAGQGLAKAVCKATTEELIGPKRKHLDCKELPKALPIELFVKPRGTLLFPDLLRCTEEPNVSIPTLANLLLERVQNPNWIVVFKSLVTIHHMMCYGNEVRNPSNVDHFRWHLISSCHYDNNIWIPCFFSAVHPISRLKQYQLPAQQFLGQKWSSR